MTGRNKVKYSGVDKKRKENVWLSGFGSKYTNTTLIDIPLGIFFFLIFFFCIVCVTSPEFFFYILVKIFLNKYFPYIWLSTNHGDTKRNQKIRSQTDWLAIIKKSNTNNYIKNRFKNFVLCFFVLFARIN